MSIRTKLHLTPICFSITSQDTENGDSKPVLARDHSLGREYLQDNQQVTLDGFSWQDPFQMPPPPPPFDPQRVGSHTSMSSFRYPSHGSAVGYLPYPPPPDDRVHSQPYRYESWSSVPPPPPLPGAYAGHSWDRNHSLGQFPLPHASVGHAAPSYPFEAGPWGPPPIYPPPLHPYVYPHPGSRPSSRPGSATHSPKTSPQRAPHSPSYNINADLASAWSGKPKSEIEKQLSGEEEQEKKEEEDTKTNTNTTKDDDDLPKPELVKRATSNQNESLETKPDMVGNSIKRAALNRDNSRASNRLKEICFPGQFSNGAFDVVKEVSELSEDMLRSNLGQTLPPLAEKPQRLTDEQRQSTVDLIAMELMVRPGALNVSTRSTTIEALDLNLDEDPVLRPPMERSTTMDSVFSDLRGDFVKPSGITMNDRMTTKDLLDIVNEPLADDDPMMDERQEI